MLTRGYDIHSVGLIAPEASYSDPLAGLATHEGACVLCARKN